MSLAYREKLISIYQMKNYFIPCMKLYFAFVTAQKTRRKSLRISYALWFLVELQKLPLGLLFAVFTTFFFFFTELSSENPIVSNGAHSVCFPLPHMRKCLLSICSN